MSASFGSRLHPPPSFANLLQSDNDGEGRAAMGKLDGRIAIVTGASRGIGEEIARLFAQEGARVVCAARTLNEGDHRLLPGSLAGTVAKIRDVGGQAIAVAVDVSSQEDCQRLVGTAQDAFGAVDILVND